MVDGDTERLERLALLIAESPHNLVSARDRDPTRLRATHLEEAVAVGRVLPVAGEQHWLDLGTGGGLPGLVLAMCFPEARWTLVDAVGKKARAVQEFARALELDNVSVVAGRAEALARDEELRARFDGVVARAVAPLVVLVELARGFVRPGGLLAAVKGPGWESELAEARRAIRALGWGAPHSERVSPTVRPTWLVRMRAAGPLAPAVPRRPGVPQRHPMVPTDSTEG